MMKSASSRYEAPRAVRLADAATGEFECTNGTEGNINFCNPSGSGANVLICNTGLSVGH